MRHKDDPGHGSKRHRGGGAGTVKGVASQPHAPRTAPCTTHHGRLSPRVAGRVCLPRTHLLYSPCSCLVFIFPTDALDLEMQSTAKMEIKDEARKWRLSWDPQVLTPALLLKCLGQACTSQERTEGKQPV